MAPEQVSQRPGELTEAVDIYGLCRSLQASHRARSFSGPNDVPSARAGAGAASRHRFVYSTARSIGDLDAICLKCLEKDPARRYESAAALSSDLNRWLAGSSISSAAVPEQRREVLKVVPPEPKTDRLFGNSGRASHRLRPRRNHHGRSRLQVRARGRRSRESRCVVVARSLEEHQNQQPSG